MKVKLGWIALLCGIGLALPVAAQEEPVPEEPPPAETKETVPVAPPPKQESDPPLHRWGGWTIGVAGWSPTLVGADEEVALDFVTGIGIPVMQESDSRVKETVRVAYHLPRDIGSVVFQYDSMFHDDQQNVFTPAQFTFFETRAFPFFLGAFDDGLADGVSSQAVRKSREFRLEYQNKAFDTKWARGTWAVGYRELSHQRSLEVTYYAIVPNLPPVIPPIVGGSDDTNRLEPIPDSVLQSSEYTGHGLGVSFDVEFPVHRLVSIVSGISIGLTRGTSDSEFSSTSSAYFLGTSTVPMTKEELFAFLSSPPVDSGDPNNPPPTVNDIHQDSFPLAVSARSESQLGQSFDVYLGVQVLAYKGLRVFAVMRDVSYTNVGEYVVPEPGPSTESTPLDNGYEGYVLGISWRF